jgi:hypothetical protein
VPFPLMRAPYKVGDKVFKTLRDPLGQPIPVEQGGVCGVVTGVRPLAHADKEFVHERALVLWENEKEPQDTWMSGYALHRGEPSYVGRRK